MALEIGAYSWKGHRGGSDPWSNHSLGSWPISQMNMGAVKNGVLQGRQISELL